MDQRRRRVAENEVRFRDINERLLDELRVVAANEKPVEFVCECGYHDCSLPVHLTLAEYRAVRRDDRRFAIRAGHEIREVERVVERHVRYWVIEKDPDA